MDGLLSLLLCLSHNSQNLQTKPLTAPCGQKLKPMLSHSHNLHALTMREAINAGLYWHVSIPVWASGGMDVIAESAADAALHVGCMLESWGRGNRPDHVAVHRHLRGSAIGCAFLSEGETCQTLTAEHYCI